MTELIPTTSYMIRAIHEWCTDNGLTPHLLVKIGMQTRVPKAYVKQGEIVLNINYSATKDLVIDQQAISFSARFSGVAQQLYIPINAVKGIFARENGQGMFFEVSDIPMVEVEAKSLSGSSQQTKLADTVVQVGSEESSVEKPDKGSHLKLVK